MTFSALLVLGGLGLAPGAPGAAVAPPLPVPVAQPQPLRVATNPAAQPQPLRIATNGDDTSASGQKAEEKSGPPPKYEFAPGGKNESIVPCTHGDAKVEDGKVEITPDDNSLKTVITGAAGANVFLGATSTATQTIQVVQEFEITCSDPSINQVVLTLESNLAGFIRSKHKASACVRLASATIAPVGWSTTPLAVSYPTLCVSGAQGYKYSEPLEPVKGPPMPLGRYVLQANFIIQATAEGFLDAHSTAIFCPESEALDPWEREHDPFVGDSHDDFGFTLTLKADTPEGSPPVAKKPPTSRRLSARAARNRNRARR